MWCGDGIYMVAPSGLSRETKYLSLEQDARPVCFRYVLKGDSSDNSAEAGAPSACKNDS